MSYLLTLQKNFEISMPFNEVISNDPSNRKAASPFAKNLLESLNGCSSCRTSVDTDSLLKALSEHYVVYGPYLAEKFAELEVPFTISWWDGLDTTGITPGILADLDNSNRRDTDRFIDVDDDYAAENPTIVIMPKENFRYGTSRRENGRITTDDEPEDELGGGGVYSPLPRDIDCRDLPEDETLELEMPQFRLNGNVAPWPRTNRLFMWTIVGEFTVADNGAINAQTNVNEVWKGEGHRVSRSNARKKNWLNTDVSFIKSDWRRSEIELRIAVAYRKRLDKEAEISGSVKVDANGDFSSEASASYKIKKWNVITMFNMAFDRCSTLARITSDEGFGTRNGYRVYRFDKFSFYLKPDRR